MKRERDISPSAAQAPALSVPCAVSDCNNLASDLPQSPFCSKHTRTMSRKTDIAPSGGSLPLPSSAKPKSAWSGATKHKLAKPQVVTHTQVADDEASSILLTMAQGQGHSSDNESGSGDSLMADREAEEAATAADFFSPQSISTAGDANAVSPMPSPIASTAGSPKGPGVQLGKSGGAFRSPAIRSEASSTPNSQPDAASRSLNSDSSQLSSAAHDSKEDEDRPLKRVRSFDSTSTVDSPKGKPWTDGEDLLLLSLAERHKDQWSVLARAFPGRSEIDVRARYLTLKSAPQASSTVSVSTTATVRPSISVPMPIPIASASSQLALPSAAGSMMHNPGMMNPQAMFYHRMMNPFMPNPLAGMPYMPQMPFMHNMPMMDPSAAHMAAAMGMPVKYPAPVPEAPPARSSAVQATVVSAATPLLSAAAVPAPSLVPTQPPAPRRAVAAPAAAPASSKRPAAARVPSPADSPQEEDDSDIRDDGELDAEDSDEPESRPSRSKQRSSRSSGAGSSSSAARSKYFEVPPGWEVIERSAAKCKYKTYISTDGKRKFRSLAGVHRFMEEEEKRRQKRAAEEKVQQTMMQKAAVAEKQLLALRSAFASSPNSKQFSVDSALGIIDGVKGTKGPTKAVAQSIAAKEEKAQTSIYTHVACLRAGAAEDAEGPQQLLSVLRALCQSDSPPLKWAVSQDYCSDVDLHGVHDKSYCDGVFAMCDLLDKSVFRSIPIDAPDHKTVLLPGSKEALLYGSAAATAATNSVLSGAIRNAFVAVRPAGHRAGPSSAREGCVFNLAAIAAFHAKRAFDLERIAIVDFDAQFDDGIQECLAGNASFLYVSAHTEPGSTSSKAGFAQNLIERFKAELSAFQPQLIVISCGFNPKTTESGIELTEDDFERVTSAVLEVADECCNGRVVSVLEGATVPADHLAMLAAAHVRQLADAAKTETK